MEAKTKSLVHVNVQRRLGDELQVPIATMCLIFSIEKKIHIHKNPYPKKSLSTILMTFISYLTS